MKSHCVAFLSPFLFIPTLAVSASTELPVRFVRVSHASLSDVILETSGCEEKEADGQAKATGTLEAKLKIQLRTGIVLERTFKESWGPNNRRSLTCKNAEENLLKSAETQFLELHSIKENDVFYKGDGRTCFSHVRDFRVVVEQPNQSTFDIGAQNGKDLEVAVPCP
ncbi:MAG: hypothetical protein AB7P04_13915 [Bacteriovoracia bacterium]